MVLSWLLSCQVFYEDSTHSEAARDAPGEQQLCEVAAHVDGLSREVQSSAAEMGQLRAVEAELAVRGSTLLHCFQGTSQRRMHLLAAWQG